jgi:TPP-dependent indolepyruvate ferredoxin oxidoreductase alpha subunit
MGANVRPIYPEKVAEAMGIDNVYTLDAFDEKAIRSALQQVFNQKGLSCMVVRGRCPYIESKQCRVSGVADKSRVVDK